MSAPGFVDGVVNAGGLPDSPLDAAAQFYGQIVPAIRSAMSTSSDLIVTFDPVDHSHDAWRLTAIQELAREAAPTRINAVVLSCDNPAGTAQTMQFLERAPGITGQILQVDGNSGDKD